jgi:SAM-dependent methyltransferase
MTDVQDPAAVDLQERVRERYARAARAVTEAGESALSELDGCCGTSTGCGCGTSAVQSEPGTAAGDTGCGEPCCGGAPGEVDAAFGSSVYTASEQDELPAAAVAASLGCGNPIMVADLRPGERVLDLGSGGGIDVLLSARRVGPTGFAYGVDMTDEMLELARANAARAGVSNVEFRKGAIESVPLPSGAVDVVISNCVVNLSVDKPAVLGEMFRVLVPGGRIGIADVVAEDHLSAQDRAARGSYVGCIAGALSRHEYLTGLADAGFVDADVTFTSEAAPGMHSAIVRARKPVA